MSTDKTTATTLEQADLLSIQLAQARLQGVHAEIEAMLYKLGLGQKRDAAQQALEEAGNRIAMEYDARSARIDIETGAITRSKPALAAVPPEPQGA